QGGPGESAPEGHDDRDGSLGVLVDGRGDGDPDGRGATDSVDGGRRRLGLLEEVDRQVAPAAGTARRRPVTYESASRAAPRPPARRRSPLGCRPRAVVSGYP